MENPRGWTDEADLSGALRIVAAGVCRLRQASRPFQAARTPRGGPRLARRVLPVPSVQPRSYAAGRDNTGVVIDFTLLNHAVTVLWEAGYFDIDSDVVEFLGGVDLLGTSLSAQLAAPPSVTGTADGKLRIGLGPLEGRGAIPLIGLGEVVFRAAATVETEVVVEDWPCECGFS